MTKILHIGKFYPPYKGGIETFTEQLSRRTANNSEFNVRVLVFNDVNKTEVENINNVIVTRSATLGVFSSQPLSYKYVFYLIAYFFWADIIHIHTPNPLGEIVTLLLSFYPKKIIVTHHSDINKQSQLKKITYFFYRLLLKRCNMLVAPTQYHHKYSDVIKGYEHKMIHIPYGIDYPEEIKAQEFTLPFEDYFLFVGRLVHYKGIKDLVKAIAKVDTNLIIAGSGEHFAQTKDLIESLNISHKVKILNSLNDQQLNHLYKNCIGLVLPSTNRCENFGIVQLEAMREAKPVIISDLESGVKGVYEGHRCALIFKTGDINDLSHKLSFLLKDELLGKRLGKNGKVTFLNKFTAESMTLRYIELYKSLLGISDSSDNESLSDREDAA